MNVVRQRCRYLCTASAQVRSMQLHIADKFPRLFAGTSPRLAILFFFSCSRALSIAFLAEFGAARLVTLNTELWLVDGMNDDPAYIGGLDRR